MGERKILRMGHPLLRQKAKALSKAEIASPELKELVSDMIDTMRSAGGIGLAAPQIGVSKLLAIIEIPMESRRYPKAKASPLLVLINPKVTVIDSTLQGFWEGCLSVPGLRGFVERPRKVQIDYLDQFGEAQTLLAEDFLSTVFQHELDHLDGVLYIDRIRDKTKLCFEEEYRHYVFTGVDIDGNRDECQDEKTQKGQ